MIVTAENGVKLFLLEFAGTMTAQALNTSDERADSKAFE